ncbi:ATP-binding protein [Streptomyces sp. NBC_00289]|uniref:ATP-binding protein n=1 Tax=Streptomyces sp. NBC_00289 TaxID=2975703 RepID=UPI00324D9703
MTTASTPPLPLRPRQNGTVMNERFKIVASRGQTPPSAEDALRVGAMRRIAAARLRHCGLEAMTADVMLIVSELVTNALVHSGTTEIHLKLAVGNGILHITVHDGMPACIPHAPADEDAESGRGLALVAALAKENGGTFGINNDGAAAWCRLTIPPTEGT